MVRRIPTLWNWSGDMAGRDFSLKGARKMWPHWRQRTGRLGLCPIVCLPSPRQLWWTLGELSSSECIVKSIHFCQTQDTILELKLKFCFSSGQIILKSAIYIIYTFYLGTNPRLAAFRAELQYWRVMPTIAMCSAYHSTHFSGHSTGHMLTISALMLKAASSKSSKPSHLSS